MLVQMLYGVWTNSLGLISDGKYLFTWSLYLVFKYRDQQYIWRLIAWQSVLDFSPPLWQHGNPMNNLLMGKCTGILLDEGR